MHIALVQAIIKSFEFKALPMHCSHPLNLLMTYLMALTLKAIKFS